MADRTITVNPRKKTSDGVITRRTLVKEDFTQGTVLLQQPLPKYSFDLKPKKKGNKSIEKVTEKDQENLLDKEDLTESGIKDISSTQNKNRKLKSSPGLKLGQDSSDLSSVNNVVLAQNGNKPVNKVGPITTTLTVTPRSSQPLAQSGSSSRTSLTTTGAVCVTDISPSTSTVTLDPSSLLPNPPSQLTPHSAVIPPNVLSSSSVTHTSEVLSSAGTQSPPVAQSINNDIGSQVVGSMPCGYNCQDKVRHLEEEKQMLRNQLDVQLQVNQELKKLLVASVGEDLQHRVERLTRDRALMTVEIGDFSKKMAEDYEHLDKISIQADMWRSKYLACRVMSDELASSRAFFSMQVQECQMALQQLLSERHELRINLHESYRGLQLIQGAFDPLNSQSAFSHNLMSKNVLDLARTNQHLVDSIKYRLLPSHVTSSMSKRSDVDWNDYLTPAESHARQLMCREMRPEDFSAMARPLPPGVMSVDRFHPFQNFDNLTFNVCRQCKGDINVV